MSPENEKRIVEAAEKAVDTFASVGTALVQAKEDLKLIKGLTVRLDFKPRPQPIHDPYSRW